MEMMEKKKKKGGSRGNNVGSMFRGGIYPSMYSYNDVYGSSSESMGIGGEIGESEEIEGYGDSIDSILMGSSSDSSSYGDDNDMDGDYDSSVVEEEESEYVNLDNEKYARLLYGDVPSYMMRDRSYSDLRKSRVPWYPPDDFYNYDSRGGYRVSYGSSRDVRLPKNNRFGLDFTSLHEYTPGYMKSAWKMVDDHLSELESSKRIKNKIPEKKFIKILNDTFDDLYKEIEEDNFYPDESKSSIKGRDLDYDFDGDGNNYEGGMFLSNLYNINKDIELLMSLVNENDNLPQWVIEKIAISKDNINTVREYLEPKINHYDDEDSNY